MTVAHQSKHPIEKSTNKSVPNESPLNESLLNSSPERQSLAPKKKVYPIFSECAEFTLDPYWKQVFEECSKSKFPKGCGINSEGQVIYFYARENNKNYTSYQLKKKNPETIFQDLKRLFQDQLHLKSNRDRQNLRDEIDDICRDLQETFTGSWQKIKRKKIKDPIIRRYILRVKAKYSLNNKETAELTQIIRLGFLFNWISNEDVIYQDKTIMDIVTLHFDKKENSFELEEPDINYRREYKPKLTKLSTLWSKHLEHPRNIYVL